MFSQMLTMSVNLLRSMDLRMRMARQTQLEWSLLKRQNGLQKIRNRMYLASVLMMVSMAGIYQLPIYCLYMSMYINTKLPQNKNKKIVMMMY